MSNILWVGHFLVCYAVASLATALGLPTRTLNVEMMAMQTMCLTEY